MNSEVENKEERIYIHVPFTEKDEAKNIGAMWDSEEQSWYVLADVSKESFEKWLTELEKTEAVETEYLCEECGAKLMQRTTKSGTLWFGCSAYPDCEVKYWATKTKKPKFSNPKK